MKLEGLSVKKLPVIATVMAVAALSSPVMAYQTGDMIVRTGAAIIEPHIDSGMLKEDGATMSPSSKISDVESNTQLGLSMTYMLGDQFGVELLATTPASHTIKTSGAVAGKFADVKHLPPTVTLQYYPMDTSSVFQPYIGAGINYTRFFDAEFKEGNKATYSGLKLQDSWGLAFQLGADYHINEHWSVNAAAWYLDIETKATFKDKTGAAIKRYSVDVDLDPMVYMVGISYRF